MSDNSGKRKQAGPGAGPLRRALLPALFLFLAAAQAGGASTAGGTQRLSAQGERELLGIVAGGRLETLQVPGFGGHQSEIDEFYRAGGYTLNWVHRYEPTAKARAVIKRLQAAGDEGLPAQDYDSLLWAGRLAELRLPGRMPSESQLLRFDLALTVCAMRYILDLHLGRINPLPFHATLDVGADVRGPSDFLWKRVVSAADVSAAFSALEPPFPSYRRLVGAVQFYKELARGDDGEKLPAAIFPVKPGDSYPGVKRLTRLLKSVGDLSPGAPSGGGIYKGRLVGAVKRFQRRHGLTPDGILGERTLSQLNTPLALRLRQLQLTLERWRWLPHRFSRPPILVNIPEFQLYAGDAPSQKVVVGIAFEHETPVFVSQLTEVVFRPPWSVPMSIQLGELVPKIEGSPSYLQGNDLEVIDGKEVLVSSGAVSAEVLARLREGQLYLRQRPGPNNSLGLVKFQMPNPHSVYLHGTPARWGFRKSERDLSHGCIRVENPEALAAWVLRDRPEWTPALIRAAMDGAETVTVKLHEPIPVLLQYGTAAVKEGGEVNFFEDIYNRDTAEGLAFEERARGGAR